MADLEGLTRVLLERYPKPEDREEIVERLITEYRYYKDLPTPTLRALALAVIQECENSAKKAKDPVVKSILEIPTGGVTIGKQGVGCRGLGDFFVHKLIAEIAETGQKPDLAPTSLDDAGAVKIEQKSNDSEEDTYIVSKMEGMHSRLSDFPFLAGFHVTRAALRDLLVKGSKPISVMVDVHLGDDADVGKLFDFMAGISAVCELANCPITAGSTLRIGGDMVIGTRLTGGIAAIGTAKHLLARRNIEVGDIILMTEGAGGGTIATTALYGGQPDVVKETLNIKFLEACQALLEAGLLPKIHAMADVTNGGLRGDLFEIDYEANTGVIVDESVVRGLVNPRVLALLDATGTDYLGVSLDALLIYCPPEVEGKIVQAISQQGVKIARIGEVTGSKEVLFKTVEGTVTSLPRFRESAYTPVKKEIGEDTPANQDARNEIVQEVMARALEKRTQIVQFIQSQRE